MQKLKKTSNFLIPLVALIPCIFFLGCFGCVGCTSIEESIRKERFEMAKNLELSGNVNGAILQFDSIMLLFPTSQAAKEARIQSERLSRLKDNTRKAWNSLQQADDESAANLEIMMASATDFLGTLRLYTDAIRESGNLYARINLLDADPMLSEHLQNCIKARQSQSGSLQTLLTDFSAELRELNDLYFNGHLNKKTYRENKAVLEMRYRLKLEPVNNQIAEDEKKLDDSDKTIMQFMINKYGLNLHDN